MSTRTRPSVASWLPIGLALALGGAPAAAEEAPLLVVFSLQGDEGVAEWLPLLNAEIAMTLAGGGRHRLMPQDELAEHLIMDPAESLAFCNQEPGCIADLATEVKASRLLFGDVKLSFDGQKVIVRLVVVDVGKRALASERFGQFERGESLVAEVGALVRELFDLPRPEAARPAAGDRAEHPAEAEQPDADEARSTAGQTGQPPPAIAALADEGPDPWLNPWTWTSFGVGLAGVGAGLTLGLLAEQKKKDAESAADQGRPIAAMGLVREAEDLALGANLAYGLGGGLLVTAVILFILDATGAPEADRPASLPPVSPGLACTPTGCGASLTLGF